jgi:hypothetical protein
MRLTTQLILIFHISLGHSRFLLLEYYSISDKKYNFLKVITERARRRFETVH